MKKKILAIYLVLIVMILSIIPEDTMANSLENNTTSVYKAIYLAPFYGDDQNDGLTDDKPVKTFAKAKELAKADKNINTIYVDGNIIVDTVEEFSLEGTKAILKRNPKHKGYLFWIRKGSTTFKNIKIDGNYENATIENSLVYVDNGASLNIEEGAILQNNHIKADSRFKNGGAIYSKEAVINMKNGIIQNNKAQYGSAVHLNNSNLNMTGGTIQNNESSLGGSVYIFKGKINLSGGKIQSNKAKFGAGIYLYKGANINMTGGIIQDNEANRGGGIYLNESNMNMSNGEITKNLAKDDIKDGKKLQDSIGGGICIDNNSTLNLSDKAIISYNSSERLGGGISVGIFPSNKSINTLNMQGGLITKNSSQTSGGGIYVAHRTKSEENSTATNTANILAGKITYNHTEAQYMNPKTNKLEGTFCGGGIYVNGTSDSKFVSGLLNLEKAIITENYAKNHGGGYAACPSASGDFYLKNGVAIYNNKVDKYGQEIYFASGDRGKGHSGNHKYSISPIMLGNIPYNWKFDYEKSSEVWLEFLTGELDPKIYKTDRVFLKTDVKENLKAEKLAKVLIAHNTSGNVGGGIGSNGTVKIGEVDFIEFKVKKEWKDNNSFNKRPSYIEVELYYSFKNNPEEKKYLGFQYMQPKDNKWEMTFKNLPRVDSENNELIYSIKEREIKNYSSKITGNMNDGFVINNQILPEKPPVVPPKTPEKPPVVPPKTPEKPPVAPPKTPEKPPVIPQNKSNATPKNLPKYSKNPKTGDEMNILVTFTLLVSLGGVVMLINKQKNKNNV